MSGSDMQLIGCIHVPAHASQSCYLQDKCCWDATPVPPKDMIGLLIMLDMT